jgi:hypothetical protein
MSVPFARHVSGRKKDTQRGPGENEMGLDALMWRLNQTKAALIRQMRLSNIDRAATIKLRQRLERGLHENLPLNLRRNDKPLAKPHSGQQLKPTDEPARFTF